MARLDGKIALITGAARGQGRSHAIRMAEEGADIIAVDICDRVESNIAPPASESDLADTVKFVEALDRRIVSYKADVRDFAALQSAVTDGVAQLGGLDIVVANAGVWNYGLTHELSESAWNEVLDIDLTGVWKTCKATIPTLIEQGRGGAIIVTSSSAGLKGVRHLSHYTAAKHGVVGLVKAMALELAPQWIRVNSVNPSAVNTDLIQNEATRKLFAPDVEDVTRRALRRTHGNAQQAAAAVDRVGRRLQRRALPRLRRGALHHRCIASGRRRVDARLNPARSGTTSACEGGNMDDARVATLLAAGGLPVPPPGRLRIDGDGPVLSYRHPIDEVAAAAIGLVGAEVADLWQLRTGREQTATVEVQAAAAALASITFDRAAGRPALPWNPTVELYESKGGEWFHLHGALPHLLDGTLELLGCENEPDQLAAAVRRWDAADLEDTLAERGLCGAVARTAEEWAAHPQGALVTAAPLVELIKIADGPPTPLPAGRAAARAPCACSSARASWRRRCVGARSPSTARTCST